MAIIIQPDRDWYFARSADAGVTPRCPFASVDECPRYYQSRYLLGQAGCTAIDSAEDVRLERKWRKSGLWPATDEEATSSFRSGDEPHNFSNFCPEVAFDRWGLFTQSLWHFADHIDRDVAERQLARQGVPASDWRWTYAAVSPLHYTECPLYAPLLTRSNRPTASPPAPPRNWDEAFFAWISSRPSWLKVILIIVIGGALGILALWRLLPSDTQKKLFDAFLP